MTVGEDPAPGVRRRQIATRDREVAHEHLTAIYPTFTPRPAAPQPFVFEDTVAEAGGLTSHHLLYGGGLEFAHAESPDRVLALHVVQGRLRLPGPDGEVTLGPGDGYLNPLAAHEGRVDDGARVLVVALPLSVVESAVAGSSPALRTGRVTQPRLAGDWAATLWHLHRQLSSPRSVLRHPLPLQAATLHLAASVAVTFPGLGGEDARHRGGAVMPGAVRRAVEFVDANAQRPISPSEIAEAAGVGVRALQLAFRKHLDTTPHRYLRRVRLEHAHAELCASHADRTTVADVAAHWGFLHPGRFSQYHREAFGTWPKDTLAQ
jgi:AraC-like DNA-binding protein